MLKKKTIIIGAALVGAVLIGVLIWDWNSAPSTFGLRRAAPGDNSKVSLRLISPGILSIAVESGSVGAAGLALQGDGTIVVGATIVVRASASERGVVLRLTSKGRLANPALALLADAETIVSGVSTARDGTIIVAGYGSPGQFSNRHFILARLLPDGALDAAFGGGGVVLANTRSSMAVGEAARAVAIQTDDRIVVTGSAGYATGPLSQGSYCVTARFRRDGRFDPSFGDNGRVLALVAGKQMCAGSSVLVAPDGKIVVAGDYASEREPRHIAVLRYLPNGAPDRRFGGDGITQLLQISANAWAAALDSQSRIVVVGTEWVSPYITKFLVVRYDTDGSLDQSFGANGIVSLHEASVFQKLLATAVGQDGKIIAVGNIPWHGTGAPEPGKRNQIAVVRLDANGAMDSSFAGGGLLIMASARSLVGHGIAIQPDGKLLIFGRTIDEDGHAISEIVLVRLNPDGTPDADFGSGVDTP